VSGAAVIVAARPAAEAFKSYQGRLGS